MERRRIICAGLAGGGLLLACSAAGQEADRFDLHCRITYAGSPDWAERFKGENPVRLSVDLLALKYSKKTGQSVVVGAMESADEEALIFLSDKSGDGSASGSKFAKFDRKNQRYLMHEGHLFDGHRSYVWGSGHCEVKPFSEIARVP